MSNAEWSKRIIAEQERILVEYRRRERSVEAELYAQWQPAEVFMRAERRRLAIKMLHEAGVFPGRGDRCLEIGFGKLGWLGELISWGVPEKNIHGIELDAIRALQAQELLPLADLRVGNAVRLPWSDGRFSLVVASTVFSSVLDHEVRKKIADEIVRVLTPGGAILWYDLAYDNPKNPNVSKIERAPLRQLFPSLGGEIKKVTLAPFLARMVAPRSWVLATCLESVKFLCTHLMAVLIKDGDRLRRTY